MISVNGGYGFVLSDHFVRLEDDIRSQIVSQPELISNFVVNMTGQLDVSL